MLNEASPAVPISQLSSCITFVRGLLERFGVGVGSDCLRPQARQTGDPWPWTPLTEAAQPTLTCRLRSGTESQSGERSCARSSPAPDRLSAERPPQPAHAQLPRHRSRRLQGLSPCPACGCPRRRLIWQEGSSEDRLPLAPVSLPCGRGHEGRTRVECRRGVAVAESDAPAALGIWACRQCSRGLASGPLLQRL